MKNTLKSDFLSSRVRYIPLERIVPNPHDSHAGEVRCTLCHKEHKASKTSAASVISSVRNSATK